MSGPYYIGVDLGGTQLRVGAVTRDGRLVKDVLSLPTGRGFGPEDLRCGLRELVARLRASLDGGVVALGFGTAGVVGHGPLSQCDNVPLLNGVILEELVREAAGCPVALENDARCFTLAEARYGAARGGRDVCGITLGTGVGCGMLAGGRLHRGAASQAGEVWRIPLRGHHLEHFVSGAGVVRSYELAGGTADNGLDAAGVEERARGGDAAALATWRSFGEDLAFLCDCVSALLDPSMIVIGGSMSRASEFYGPVLAARMEGRPTRIVAAELGAAAGVIGAAALNFENSGG